MVDRLFVSSSVFLLATRGLAFPRVHSQDAYGTMTSLVFCFGATRIFWTVEGFTERVVQILRDTVSVVATTWR